MQNQTTPTEVEPSATASRDAEGKIVLTPIGEPAPAELTRDVEGKLQVTPAESIPYTPPPGFKATMNAEGDLVLVSEKKAAAQEAAKNAQRAAPDAPPATARSRSPFRTHQNFVAGHVKIDETTYFYGQLSDPLREWMEARPKAIAEKLGVSLGAFERDNYAPDTPENRGALAKLPEEQRPELADPDEIKKLPNYFEETYNRVLEKCLVGCDFPGVDFERTPEMKLELAMEVKAALVQQISRSSKYGLSQTNFLFQGA